MTENLRDFFEDQLFRSLGNQRFTQDSPVFPDVWLQFATNPGKRCDLLLTPCRGFSAQQLAEQLRERLANGGEESTAEGEIVGKADRAAKIAANMTTVAARLTFREVIRLVVPMTAWWDDVLWNERGSQALDWYQQDASGFSEALERALAASSYQSWIESEFEERKRDLRPPLIWLCHVAGTICLAESEKQQLERSHISRVRDDIDTLLTSDNSEIRTLAGTLESLANEIDERERWDESRRVQELRRMAREGELIRSFVDLLQGMCSLEASELPSIQDVNRNRRTEASIYRSGKATKSDAVRHLFDVRGRGIRWAVIDSGIDARHVAFRRRLEDGRPAGERTSLSEAPKPLTSNELQRPEPASSFGHWAFCRVPNAPGNGWLNQTRIVATYDFSGIRELLSATSVEDVPDEFVTRAVHNRSRKRNRRSATAALRRALKFGSMVDWQQLEEFLRVPHTSDYEPPRYHHGTHVAGVLGADWRSDEHELSPAGDRQGIAPEIEIYDLRALDDEGRGDEFSIMAAMQFVRYLNLRRTSKDQMEVHGANLSFAIKHEVANFACGRTPVCDEADRLAGAGVVVVAAAGNQGRARYQTVKGLLDEGYRSISITDPGNSRSAITVGATHSHEPHTYGVSYFSSRGPTGDGRPKPDLVAPGENIYSTIPGNAEGNADGTSQAAPHVSGAAALLMERNVELIGEPARIKDILCQSATDLGREAYFQGAGMLDILRAMQSV